MVVMRKGHGRNIAYVCKLLTSELAPYLRLETTLFPIPQFYMTTQEFNQLLDESARKVQEELIYRQTISIGSSPNARKVMADNLNPYVKSEIDKADILDVNVLSRYVSENFHDFDLEFIKTNKDSKMSHMISFMISDIQEIMYKHIVFRGKISEKRAIKEGCIEFNFDASRFYIVRLLANGSVRRLNDLDVDPDSYHTTISILNFLRQYLSTINNQHNDAEI